MNMFTRLCIAQLALALAACNQFAPEQSSKESAKSSATAKKGGTSSGATLKLSVPKDSNQEEGSGGGSDGAEVTPSKIDGGNMADEFDEGLGSEYFDFSCDDGAAIKSVDAVANKTMNGFFVIILSSTLRDEGKSDTAVDEKKDSDEEMNLKDGNEKQNPKEEQAASGDEATEQVDEGQPTPDAEPAEGGSIIFKKVAIPYVCEANMTVHLKRIDPSATYKVEANLYTNESELTYSGTTEEFKGDAGKVSLTMEPAVSTNVDLQVIFAKNPKK